MEYMDGIELDIIENGNQSSDLNPDLSENNTSINSSLKKRRTNVGPWRNKEEFNEVYLLLFGSYASHETKRKACKKMTIWKLRSLNLTPASILSTLAILEIQLKDESTKCTKELQLLHAGAFTRFLNYMCSTGQKGKLKTMYQIAMDVGIDPFIVDLRHLCAHGQTMPSIDILRRASDYCLKWLKEFYWDHEYTFQTNVDAKNVRRKDIASFDDRVSQLFKIYDCTLLLEQKGCSEIKGAHNFLNEDSYDLLKTYCDANDKYQIIHIQNLVIKNLENLIRSESNLKNFVPEFIEGFTKMVFIFEIPDSLTDNKEKLQNFVKTNRGLFRSIAMHGLIERLFDELIYISENSFELPFKRKGAGFWANEIALGFIAFDKFKNYCKTQKQKDNNFKIDKKDVNNLQGLSKGIKKIYSNLGIDANSIIIFGDHYKRPWSLSFSESYIEERLKNICGYTKNIIKNCLPLVDPPLSDCQKTKLDKIIDIYCCDLFNNQENVNMEMSSSNLNESSSKIYSLESDIYNKGVNNEIVNLEFKEENKFGIWSIIDDEQDWHLIPLGRLPWE